MAPLVVVMTCVAMAESDTLVHSGSKNTSAVRVCSKVHTRRQAQREHSSALLCVSSCLCLASSSCRFDISGSSRGTRVSSITERRKKDKKTPMDKFHFELKGQGCFVAHSGPTKDTSPTARLAAPERPKKGAGKGTMPNRYR